MIIDSGIFAMERPMIIQNQNVQSFLTKQLFDAKMDGYSGAPFSIWEKIPEEIENEIPSDLKSEDVLRNINKERKLAYNYGYHGNK